MLVIRAYDVMGRFTVEVTCVGHSAEGAGHLLYRGTSSAPLGCLEDVLEAAVDHVERARYLEQRGELEETDDCWP